MADEDRPLTEEERAVLKFLADVAVGENRCATGTEIAKGTGLSDELVALCIAALVGRGVLLKVSQELALWVQEKVQSS